MRKILLAGILAAATVCATAQKYDRENLEFNNTHIPSRLIYDQVKTYSYTATVFGGDPSQLTAAAVTGMAYAFKSFDRLDNGAADMKISYTVGPFTGIGEKTVSRVQEDEVNKVKVRTTKYKRVYEFRYPVRVEVVNAKTGVKLYANEYTSANTRSIESYEFNSEGEAYSYMEKNRNEFLQRDITAHVGLFVKGVNAALSDQYDFFPASTTLNIFQFKKWDKDDEYNKHVAHVKSVMKLMTAGESGDLYRQKLAEDIAYFQSFEGQFKPDDKEDILYFGNYANLATLFFCMDDLDKAEFYLAKLDSSDKKEGMTNLLKGYVKSARTRMQKHFLTSTHLDYNPVKDYRLAGKSFTSDALSAAENAVNDLKGGGIAKANDEVKFANGTTVKGKVIYYAENNTLKLVPVSNPDTSYLLNPDNTLSFIKDSVGFVSAKSRQTGVVTKQFFKVRYQSPRILLLGLLTPTLTDGATYATLRPSEELVTVLGGFGMKKDLSKYFEDCQTVSKKAKDGDYGTAMNADVAKFMAMCEEYTNGCK